MLLELGIRNFAIVDELRLSFEDGMNAITGETGAGKSIIIDALGAVLGERIGAEVVRTGAKSAMVEAIFDLRNAPNTHVLDALAEIGVEPDEGTLILSRQIQAGGRTTARINGTTQTIGALGSIGALLMDIHGQSDHLKLLRPNVQLDALDHFAGTMAIRNRAATLVQERADVRRRRDHMRTGERDRAQRIDLLRYQTDEITSANLVDGEDELLIRERSVLANAERLTLDTQSALEHLGSETEDGAASQLRLAAQAIVRIAEVDSGAAILTERANELVILAEDLGSELRRYADLIDADPGRLGQLDDRAAVIQQLKRKYGATIAEILTYQNEAGLELESLNNSSASDEALAEHEARVTAELAPVLNDLSRQRRDAGKRLERAIDNAISELGLGSAHVRIQMVPLAEPNENGGDQVEFLFAPNTGEVLKPLARIASGGETARLMLALKSVLAEGDATPTLVFDEVDVGVGARSGQAVGEKLWSLSRRHQVIVISHLAQIAAFAETHFMIEKDLSGGRTTSSVTRLEGDHRMDELAEMIDGKPVSPESRAAAEQLLDRVSGLKAAAR